MRNGNGGAIKRRKRIYPMFHILGPKADKFWLKKQVDHDCIEGETSETANIINAEKTNKIDL